MGKAEKHGDKPSDDASNLEKTKWAAAKLGQDKAKKAEIVALLTEAKVEFSESSIGQKVAEARKELGYPALRRTHGDKEES